jgi:hypothetical protein
MFHVVAEGSLEHQHFQWQLMLLVCLLVLREMVES